MSERIVQLDVRPYLRKKREPFQLIMHAVNALAKEEMLLVHATIKPTPLVGLLKMKGYASRIESAGPDHWMAAFLHKSQGKSRLEALSFERYADLEEAMFKEEALSDAPAPDSLSAVSAASPAIVPTGRVVELDNRGLEPPQPMIRTLKALEGCEAGDRVVIHNDRVPMFLLEELQRLGSAYRIEEQADGSAKVEITKS